MSTSRGKGRTGLEWLLDEARKPEPATETERSARPDPVEAALAQLGPQDPAAPEPWTVVPLQPVPAEESAAAAAALPSRESMRANALETTLRADAAPLAAAPPAAAPQGGAATPATSGRARELRARPRAVLDFELRFRKGSEAIVAPGRNVSRSGLFVETRKFLPQGEVFQCQLLFGDPSNVRMSVIAEVIWLSAGDAEDPGRYPPGMGLKFLDVDDKDLPFLDGLAAKRD